MLKVQERPRPVARAPGGFINRYRHIEAGIGVNWSPTLKAVGVQFAEDRRADRDAGEVETLQSEGFRFDPLRRQWQKLDADGECQISAIAGLGTRPFPHGEGMNPSWRSSPLVILPASLRPGL